MWTCDFVQFARLIAELNAAGAFTDEVMSDLTASMDLSPAEVNELRVRADRLWDEVTQHANPAAWIAEQFGDGALRSTLDVLDDLDEEDELDEGDDRPEVPADFPVTPLGPDDPAEDRATCGTCGRSWDDAVPTSYTPTPSGRCPFEAFH